jgi:hypothetical protein
MHPGSSDGAVGRVGNREAEQSKERRGDLSSHHVWPKININDCHTRKNLNHV